MALQLVAAKIVVGLAIAAAAAGGVAAGGHAGQEVHQAAVAASERTYTVEAGNTLFGIAERFCGRGDDYRALAAASGIGNPNLIYVGQRIVLACGGSSGSASGAPVQTTGNTVANGQANIPGTTPAVFSYYGLEQVWVTAGGSRAEEGVAACIAEHESGGRTYAVSPTNDYGLWQIHDAVGLFNPIANAQRAIYMSDNGRDWHAWTTHYDCGV